MKRDDIPAEGGGIALAAAIEGKAASPDGFVRIEANDELWTGLAKGCAEGLQISARFGSTAAGCTWRCGPQAAP